MYAAALRHSTFDVYMDFVFFWFLNGIIKTRAFGKNSILRKTKIQKNLNKQQPLKRVLIYTNIYI